MSISHRRRGGHGDSSVDAVAGNGLLDRRALLGALFLRVRQAPALPPRGLLPPSR